MNNCNKKSNYVAMIEDEPITLEEYNVRLEYYLKSKYIERPDLIHKARNNMEERKAALRDIINERIILKEAKKLKVHEKQEVKDMMKLYTQQIILNNYLEELLAGEIKVSEEDIDEFYSKNRGKFIGMDPDKIRFLINRELSLRQYEIKLKEILDKLKQKYRIEENESAIRPIVSETNILQGQEDMGDRRPIPQPQLPEAKIKSPKKELPKQD